MTGLKPQTTYCVKMAAENSAGRSPFCEALPVQTEPDSECLLITVYMVSGDVIFSRFITESMTSDFRMFWPQAFVSCMQKEGLYAAPLIEQCTNEGASTT